MNRLLLAPWFLVGGALASAACSSSEQPSADQGVGGGLSDDLVVESGGGPGSGAGSGVGGGSTSGSGAIALTPSQLDAIRERECTGESSEAEQFPAVLELVVDVSLSMRDPAPGGGGTKWDVTQRALISALEALPPSLAVGLQLFPTSDAENGRSNPGCVDERGRVPIAALGPDGSPQREALREMLGDARLLLGTPTHDAFSVALEEGLNQYDGLGQRFMLLITDGAPTQLLGCGVLNGAESVDTVPIIASIADAAQVGVRTFVIGSPGSEVSPSGDMRPWLSEAALKGGTPLVGCSLNGPDFCHLDMTEAADFSAALSQGLESIAAQVGDGCTFEVPEGDQVDRATTSLIIEWGNGMADLILNVGGDTCAGAGWTWSPTGQIELCDATCAQVNRTPGARVSVSLDCDLAAIEDIFK